MRLQPSNLHVVRHIKSTNFLNDAEATIRFEMQGDTLTYGTCAAIIGELEKYMLSHPSLNLLPCTGEIARQGQVKIAFATSAVSSVTFHIRVGVLNVVLESFGQHYLSTAGVWTVLGALRAFASSHYLQDTIPKNEPSKIISVHGAYLAMQFEGPGIDRHFVITYGDVFYVTDALRQHFREHDYQAVSGNVMSLSRCIASFQISRSIYGSGDGIAESDTTDQPPPQMLDEAKRHRLA